MYPIPFPCARPLPYPPTMFRSSPRPESHAMGRSCRGRLLVECQEDETLVVISSTHEGFLSSLPSFLSWPLPELMQCNAKHVPPQTAVRGLTSFFPASQAVNPSSAPLFRLACTMESDFYCLVVCVPSFVDRDFAQSNPLVCLVRHCPTLVLKTEIGCSHGDNLPVSLIYPVSRGSHMPLFSK